MSQFKHVRYVDSRPMPYWHVSQVTHAHLYINTSSG